MKSSEQAQSKFQLWKFPRLGFAKTEKLVRLSLSRYDKLV